MTRYTECKKHKSDHGRDGKLYSCLGGILGVLLASSISGCGGGGSGGDGEPVSAADRSAAAAKTVDGYLASFSKTSTGAPDPSYFSSNFTCDGLTGPEYVGLRFGGADQVEKIRRGVRLNWSSEEEGATWQETLTYTRSGFADGRKKGEPVWIELTFKQKASEVFQGETYSYEGSGFHYLALLEKNKRSRRMKIIHTGPYRELEQLIQPPPSASHYYVARSIQIGEMEVYAAETFAIYQVPVSAGTTLAVSVPVDAVPLPSGQGGDIELAIGAMLFDDDSPALARYQDSREGLLCLYRRESGLPQAGSFFGLSGELELPADLAPGPYTLSVSIETLDLDGNFVAGELIVLSLLAM